VPVLVTVYPLQVDRLLPQWKEAAKLVEDAGLSGLLRQLTAV
jgi:hypothetical protein